MIAARGHGRAVDFWSLGVFLFELLHRATPFEQNDTVSFLDSSDSYPLHDRPPFFCLISGWRLSKNHSL
jgi:serine/threonine protein kinase